MVMKKKDGMVNSVQAPQNELYKIVRQNEELKGFILLNKTNEEYKKKVLITYLKIVNYILIKDDVHKIKMIIEH
jgi:hypothetical protein